MSRFWHYPYSYHVTSRSFRYFATRESGSAEEIKTRWGLELPNER